MASSAAVKIVYLSAEVAPFAKTGGLGDVIGALPAAMSRAGHEVRVFMPFYSRIDRTKYRLSPVGIDPIEVRLGAHRYTMRLVSTTLPGSDVPVYLLHCPVLYDREGIYANDGDEHLRFLAFSWGALIACQRLRFAPDVVHCNDWHTALVPLTLRTRF